MSIPAADSTWVVELCLASDKRDPAALLETLFADERCDAFGPIHHFLVGAALLTAYANTCGQDKEALTAELGLLGVRSSAVPGAACAHWGICGAAISAGMAYSIIADNQPLKKEGWAQDQRMVADIATAIAETGAPRCCKRDTRLAIDHARKVFEDDFAMQFDNKELPTTKCIVAGVNTVCIKQACPYHEKR